MANDVSIKINLNSDESGGKKATKTLKELETQGLKTAKSATTWGDAFKLSFATQAITNAVRAFSVLPTNLNGVIERGNEFNQTMLNAQAAIAGVFASARPEAFRTVADATGTAARAVAMLRDEARSAGLSQKELVSTFQISSGALTQIGIPIEKQIRLVADATKAMTAYGYSGEQVAQDLSRLISGNGKNRLGDILGFRADEIKSLREAGKLTSAIADKVSALSTATASNSQSPAAVKARLNDTIDEATGKVAEAAMVQISEGFLDLGKAIETIPEETLRSIGEDFGRLVRFGTSILEFGAQNAKVVEQLMRWGVFFGVIKGGLPILLKLTKMVKNIGSTSLIGLPNFSAANGATSATGAASAAPGIFAVRRLERESKAALEDAAQKTLLAKNSMIMADRRDAEVRALTVAAGDARYKANNARSVADSVPGSRVLNENALKKASLANVARYQADTAATKATAFRALAETRATAAANAKTLSDEKLALATNARAASEKTVMGRMGKIGGAMMGAAHPAVMVAAAAATLWEGVIKPELDKKDAKEVRLKTRSEVKAGNETSAVIDENRRSQDARELAIRQSETLAAAAKFRARAKAAEAEVAAANAKFAAATATFGLAGALAAAPEVSEDAKIIEHLNLQAMRLENEAKKMQDADKFLQENKEFALIARADAQREKLAQYTEKDYEELEALRDGKRDDFTRLTAARERSTAAQAKFSQAQIATAPTGNKELDNLNQKALSMAERDLLAAKKEEDEIQARLTEKTERRRRVAADLKILQMEALGATQQELTAQSQKEERTRRIFDLTKQLTAEGYKQADAAREAAKIADAEASAKKSIVARQTAESLRDIYANLLITDLQLKGVGDAQVAAMREQATILARIEELKKKGLDQTKAEAIAAKEAQQARQKEATDRAKSIAIRDMERKEREVRASGDTKAADKMKTQLSILAKAEQYIAGDSELSGSEEGRQKALKMAHEDAVREAQIQHNEKIKEAQEMRQSGRSGKSGKSGKSERNISQSIPIPVMPEIPTLAELNAPSGASGYLSGRMGQAAANAANSLPPAPGTAPGALPGAGTGGAQPGAGGMLDLSGRLGATVKDEGRELLASVDGLGAALSAQYRDFRSSLDTLTEQIKNQR